MSSRDDTMDTTPPERPWSFVPISVATLGLGESLRVDLYVRKLPTAPPVLYRSAKFPADRAEVQRLLTQGITTIYIGAQHYGSYQDYLQLHLQAFLSDTTQPASMRMAFLAEHAREVLKLAFESRDAVRLARHAFGLADEIVRLVVGPPVLAADLFALLRHDACLFAHSFHVAAYSAIMAREWGLSDRPTLQALTLAALLHDIGKLRLPAKLLHKPDALNSVEQRLVRQHPQFGFERLCHRQELNYDQLMVVYQHHERLDGLGYPVGLAGDEIHPWARLTAVTNAFDARTMVRPHHPGYSAREALEYLQHQAGSAFDQEMVACWTKCVTA